MLCFELVSCDKTLIRSKKIRSDPIDAIFKDKGFVRRERWVTLEIINLITNFEMVMPARHI